jgi:hypothetical protein
MVDVGSVVSAVKLRLFIPTISSERPPCAVDVVLTDRFTAGAARVVKRRFVTFTARRGRTPHLGNR